MKTKPPTRKSLSVRLPVDLIEAARERARRRDESLREAVQKLLELYAKGFDPDDVVLIPVVNLLTSSHPGTAPNESKRKP